MGPLVLPVLCSQCASLDVVFAMMSPDNYDICPPPVKLVANFHDDEAPEGAAFKVLGPQSPLEWQKAATVLAFCFKDELRYDFELYSYHEFQVDPSPENKLRVLVFWKRAVEAPFPAMLFFGAVGVRRRKRGQSPMSWSIEWAWFHPSERRLGHLTTAWPLILQMFPAPKVAPPLSEGMIGFLKKVGYTAPLADDQTKRL
jgi:hypothetical protein